jgi:predicted dehydrogenase
MEKIKLGIIGLGGIAQIIHLPILSKMNGVEIAAVSESDSQKCKKIATKYGIRKYYRDSSEMLSESPDLHAVIIAAPTNLHRNIAIECLEAGKDILIEKPIARNHKEAKDIVESAKKNKRRVMVAMNNRFRNDMMMQRTFTKAREIGEIFYIKTGWVKPQSSNQKWILEKEKAGGGVFLDNGIAMLDLGMWLLGFPDVKSVTSTDYFHNTKSVEDSSIAYIRFRNGTVLTIEASWSLLREGELFYCNVYGKEGSSSINPFKIYKKMDGNLYNITPKKIAMPSNVFKKSYEYELQHFVGAVRGNHNIISSGEEAVKVMEIADAVYKSAKSGKEIIFK